MNTLREKTRVLLVDDEKDMLKAIETLLKTSGYTVMAKSDPENMLEAIREFRPDVLLLDYLLSGTDGKEITKKIKSREDLYQLPIILISAHPFAEEKAHEAGADSFLSKPFDMQELTNTIDSVHKKNQDIQSV